MVVNRFDVYLANLDPTVGSEIQKTRPCLIISPDEMSQLIMAGTILFRPTQLIKLTTDPRVYVVTKDGNLRLLKDEAVAKALFGNNWNTLIKDVSPIAFGYYAIDESQPISQESESI